MASTGFEQHYQKVKAATSGTGYLHVGLIRLATFPTQTYRLAWQNWRCCLCSARREKQVLLLIKGMTIILTLKPRGHGLYGYAIIPFLQDFQVSYQAIAGHAIL